MLSNGVLPKKEILGIDILRFSCAFLVVIHHYFSAISPTQSLRLGGGAVDIFFLISGFIIPFSAEGRSAFAFIKSRVVRLVPGVWICATLTLVVFLSLNGLSSEQGIFGKYVRSVLFIPLIPWKIENLGDMWIDGVYWTLFVEIAFYLMILLLLLLNRINLLPVLASFLGTISTLYWGTFFIAYLYWPASAFAHWIEDTGFKRVLDLTLIHHGAWFGLGINVWLLMKTRSQVKILPSFLVCLLGGMLEASHNSVFYLDTSPIPIVIYDLLGILFILTAVFWQKARQHYSDGTYTVCRWIGLMTYPLYLIHDRMGNTVIKHLVDTNTFNIVTATWLTVAFMIFLSFCIAYLAEPPLQAALRRGFDRFEATFDKKNDSGLFRKTVLYS